MGYVFNFQDAVAYENWCRTKRDPCAIALEVRLMQALLKPAQHESVLDIGCGTGGSLCALLDMGLNVTGLDPSPYVLDIAFEKVENRAELYRGYAEDLPFEDNSFNHACFFSSLEFVSDPRKALSEAARVAKDKLFIGVLNRYAYKGIERRLKGMFTRTIYNRARFFSIWELKYIMRSMLGPVPMKWRTVGQLPVGTGRIVNKIESSNLIQRIPFGAFAGLVVTLMPRFRTRPMTLKHHAKRPAGAMSGCISGARCDTHWLDDEHHERMAG